MTICYMHHWLGILFVSAWEHGFDPSRIATVTWRTTWGSGRLFQRWLQCRPLHAQKRDGLSGKQSSNAGSNDKVLLVVEPTSSLWLDRWLWPICRSLGTNLWHWERPWNLLFQSALFIMQHRTPQRDASRRSISWEDTKSGTWLLWKWYIEEFNSKKLERCLPMELSICAIPSPTLSEGKNVHCGFQIMELDVESHTRKRGCSLISHPSIMSVTTLVSYLRFYLAKSRSQLTHLWIFLRYVRMSSMTLQVHQWNQ